MNRIIRSLGSVLPGLFLVGFTIGTGSVTAMVKAGADHGMALLWALLLSCIVSYCLFSAFGNLTVVSGKTALHAIRQHIHPAVSLSLFAAIVVNVSGSIMGVMGIVADVLSQWSATWFQEGVSPLVWAAGLSAIIVGVLFAGTIRSFEKLLAALAGVMGVCFLCNAALMLPSAQEILSGLIPTIPAAEGDAGGGYLVAASMVGTTVAPIVLLFRSILVHEEAWTVENLAQQRRDARISAVLIFFISAAIMASASGGLHTRGVGLQHAKEMIPLLQPIAGGAAVLIFVVGITAAGVSSQFPNVVSVAWFLHDYRGERAQICGTRDRLIVIVMAMLGLVVPIFHARPVWIMLVSQALGALVLPTTVICLAYLLNQRQLMREHVNSLWDNVVMALIIIFSLAMAGIGFYGLFLTAS